MSENQGQQSETGTKKRKTRGPSKFIVLRATDAGYAMPIDGAKTIKECRARIAKEKIVGKLIIACVRRVGETKLQESLDIEGL